MPNPYFSFKQFTVYHDRCAMKVGTDGVLLGAWATVTNSKTILDIGTGTGLVALMLCQRSAQSHITAIEIDENAVNQASDNVRNSPWENRINVLHTSLQDFACENNFKFDLIVSNPPFFVDSLKAPNKSRTHARHADTLTHQELLINARKLMHSTSRLCVILPVNEGIAFVNEAADLGLYCNKRLNVYPKPGLEVKRLLLEFAQYATETEIADLNIESGERHSYSKEFSEMLRDFYLKL